MKVNLQQSKTLQDELVYIYHKINEKLMEFDSVETRFGYYEISNSNIDLGEISFNIDIPKGMIIPDYVITTICNEIVVGRHDVKMYNLGDNNGVRTYKFIVNGKELLSYCKN